MKTHVCIIIILLSPVFLLSQNLEVEGKVKITVMDDDIISDSMVVLRPGGELARRHISSLPDNTAGWAEVTNITSTMNRVGIGTTSPLKKLHIQAGGAPFLTSSFGDGMLFSTNSNSGARIFLENLTGASGQKTMALVNENVIGGQGGTTYFGSLSDDGSAWINKGILSMVHSSGNVGIGELSPSEKLHVNGNLKVAGTISGVSDPVNDQDAATKAYVDALEAEILFLKEFLGILPIMDIDGNEYATRTIGTQSWMAENLRTTKYNDGTIIQEVSDSVTWSNLTSPAYSWYDNDAASNADTYGALYNFYSVADTNSLNVCPTGWHVPSDQELIVLWDFLVNNGYGFGGSGSDIGKSMASTFGWTNSGTAGHVGNDQGTNNSSMFAGLPGGERSPIAIFEDLVDRGNWWTSRMINGDAVGFSLNYDVQSLLSSELNKGSGFSVRCIKD